MRNAILRSSLCVVGLLAAGCGSDALSNDVETTGTLQAALSIPVPDNLGPKHDVVKIRYVVVKAGSSCTDKPLAETTVDLETESAPKSLLPDGGGAAHPFGDALLVLAPGRYNVCAIPLTKAGGSSEQCPTASTPVMIAASATTEISLISQCRGTDNGAADAVTVLNSPPVIDDIEIEPSKFITLCDRAVLTVEAHDPDGDNLSFLWQLLGSNMSSTNQTINFRSLSTGTFQLRVTVSDPFGASTSVTIPIHVSACTDGGAG